MLFRDSKSGYPIYILNRKDVSLQTGKITNVSLPHFDAKMSANATKMVVDIDVMVDGKSTSYVMDDSGEVGYVGDYVISINRDAILREIERIKNQSDEALKMINYHRDAIGKCDKLLKDFSPEYKERLETSERMTTLENKVDKLTDALTALVNKIDKEKII